MLDLGRARFHPRSILWTSLLIFAAAFWLRVEAHDLCTHHVHQADPSGGPDFMASFTDEYRVGAYIDVARAGLVLGVVLCAAALSAWLFVPTDGHIISR